MLIAYCSSAHNFSFINRKWHRMTVSALKCRFETTHSLTHSLTTDICRDVGSNWIGSPPQLKARENFRFSQ